MGVTNPNPMHPGEVLEEYYMKGMELSQSGLARLIGCHIAYKHADKLA